MYMLHVMLHVSRESLVEMFNCIEYARHPYSEYDLARNSPPRAKLEATCVHSLSVDAPPAECTDNMFQNNTHYYSLKNFRQQSYQAVLEQPNGKEIMETKLMYKPETVRRIS